MGPVDMEQIVRLVQTARAAASSTSGTRASPSGRGQADPRIGSLLPRPCRAGSRPPRPAARGARSPAKAPAAAKPSAVPPPRPRRRPPPPRAASRRFAAGWRRNPTRGPTRSSWTSCARRRTWSRRSASAVRASSVTRVSVAAGDAGPDAARPRRPRGGAGGAGVRAARRAGQHPGRALPRRCLEALGDLAGARERFEAALKLAPSDVQLATHLRALEQRDTQTPEPAAPEDPLASLDLGPAAAPPPAADGLDIEFDAAPPPPPEEPKPIPLVAVNEPFEIERAGDVGAWKPPRVETPAPPPRPAAAPAKAAPAPPARAAAATPAAPPAAKPARPAPVAAAPARPRRFPRRWRPPRPPERSTPRAHRARPAVAWPSGRLADHEFADIVSEVTRGGGAAFSP